MMQRLVYQTKFYYVLHTSFLVQLTQTLEDKNTLRGQQESQQGKNQSEKFENYSAIQCICPTLTDLGNDFRTDTGKYDSFEPTGTYQNGHMTVLSVRKT